MDNILIIPIYCKNCNYYFFPIQYKFRGFCSGECYYSHYSKLLFSESSVIDKKIPIKLNKDSEELKFSL